MVVLRSLIENFGLDYKMNSSAWLNCRCTDLIWCSPPRHDPTYPARTRSTKPPSRLPCRDPVHHTTIPLTLPGCGPPRHDPTYPARIRSTMPRCCLPCQDPVHHPDPAYPARIRSTTPQSRLPCQDPVFTFVLNFCDPTDEKPNQTYMR